MLAHQPRLLETTWRKDRLVFAAGTLDELSKGCAALAVAHLRQSPYWIAYLTHVLRARSGLEDRGVVELAGAVMHYVSFNTTAHGMRLDAPLADMAATDVAPDGRFEHLLPGAGTAVRRVLSEAPRLTKPPNGRPYSLKFRALTELRRHRSCSPSHPALQSTVRRCEMRSPVGAGVVAGLIAGVVFGMMMTMMTAPTPDGDRMPMMAMVAQVVGSTSLVVGWAYHLFNSAVIGGIFGWLLGARARDWGAGLGWGALYGAAWWILGGLILMPVLLGMPAFAPLMMSEMRPVAIGSLIGHLVFGVILGAAVVALRRWAAADQETAARTRRAA